MRVRARSADSLARPSRTSSASVASPTTGYSAAAHGLVGVVERGLGQPEQQALLAADPAQVGEQLAVRRPAPPALRSCGPVRSAGRRARR